MEDDPIDFWSTFDPILLVLEHLEPLEICRAARLSRAVLEAASDEVLWRTLLQRRYAVTDERMSARANSARAEFRSRWSAAQDLLRGADFSSRAPPVLCTIPPNMGQVVCSSPRKAAEGLSEDAFKRGVAFIGAAIACGHVSFGDLADFLLSAAATREPVHCAGLLFVLHFMQTSPVEFSQALAPGRADARRRLAAASRCGAPPALRASIVVKYSTWSQSRDCRGFRARDDIHRVQAPLLTLSEQPEHELWRVLERGAINEVRCVSVLAAAD